VLGRVCVCVCVCLVWREKGGEDKRHVRASGERSGNEFGHVFWRRPDRRRFSQAGCRVVLCCREAGDRGAGRDITTRQDRDEEMKRGGRQGRRRLQSP
jgi:hypothetical protein